MANWMQIPGGQVVNADNVDSVEVQNTLLILHMSSGEHVSKAYGSSSAAYSAKASVESSLLNPTSGSPTIVTVAPNSVPANGDANVVVTGSAFQTTALITIGGQISGGTTFVSSTTLQVFWQGFTLAAGTYNVVYTDSAGGTNTLVNGFTVT